VRELQVFGREPGPLGAGRRATTSTRQNFVLKKLLGGTFPLESGAQKL